MPDWKRYHAATLAGSAQAEIPDACDLAWSWLNLPPAERRARIVAAIRGEPAARWMQQALPFVRLRLLREAGIAADDQARFAALDAAMRAGRATAEEQDLVRRFNAAVEIGQTAAALFPGAAMPPAPADPQREALAAQLPALTAAMHGGEVGLVTPASLADLRKAIDAFAAIGKGMTAPASHDHAWWLGLAWWFVGRGALELGRNDEGRAALERAAASYALANDEKSAAECRQWVRDLDLHVAADFDSAAARELRELLVQRDPLGRVQTLTRLLQEVGSTGDQFEAARVAETAAHILGEAGYPDPEPGFDVAVDSWIASASASCTGNALFARLCEVARYWAAILGARTSARMKTDAAGSARAEHALRQLVPLSTQLFEEAGRAEQAAAARMAHWYPQGAPQPYTPHSTDESTRRHEDLTALDDALYQLRLACNAGASDAHIAQADGLRARAEALGSRVHIARAQLEHVYVLLALGRFAEVPPLADAALRTLLGDQPARLSAFATGYERDMYLNAVAYKARSLASRGDHDGVLAACEPVIRDIEGERARVNSPYQQSAFLVSRAEIYELAAAAAYRAQRWDLLLAVTELLKARAALRSRLAPAPDADASEVESEFTRVNAALARAERGSAEEHELLERRRWVLTARAIARARRGGAEAPEITVAAVQRALETDEAAISWFWVAPEIAIVLAITREHVQPALVRLDEAARAQHDEYLHCVTALTGARPDYARLIPRVGQLIAALGATLLPAQLHAFVAGKSRLVLSPHRTLHLFPFHAAPWPAGDENASVHLIERFAVRYVPNLCSLLLPWSGNATGPVLAVGVARFDDPALPPLPNAEAEAGAVAAAHGAAGHALTGVTRAQFTALPLHEYRCLHLATHGSSVLVGDAVDDPLQSCLFLRDGALTGWELAALRLRTELVVLAACHSGQRAIGGRGLEKLPGDDIFGLQAVLFDAGVGTVLGTLWPVEDATALAILVDFHRAYASGVAPERALQAAIRAHLADAGRRRDAFYWAPFFLSSLGRQHARPGPAVPSAESPGGVS